MRPVIRNKGLIVGIFLVLSATIGGCGENSAMLTAVQTLRAAAFGTPETEFDRERISTIPYALISARVGKLPSAILVLGYDEPTGQQWFSTNKISLSTRFGRLVQSVGLPTDIRETRHFGRDPLSNRPNVLDSNVDYSRELSGWSAQQSTSIVTCELLPGEPETIDIADLTFDTRRLTETCRDDTGYTFENVYWVDAYDGFVWRSRQKWGQGGPLIEISVLKPPGDAGQEG